ncbi:hypothetical protein RUND412_002446 [Rhizina undulata]
MTTIQYLPPVKPSAIALGTIFTQTANLAVMAPLFGETYHKARNANTKEEFLKSKEAATTATAYCSSLVGSGLQTYAVAAILNQSGILSYKGAAYLGSLLFAVSSVPSMITQLFVERRPAEYIAVTSAASLIETVGLSVFLTWWGTRPARDLLR